MNDKIKHHLESLVLGEIKWDCSLKRFTSFAVGGPASALIKVNINRELVNVLKFCNKNIINWYLVGKGTNLLVSDDGFDGVVLLLGDGFKFCEVSSQDKNIVNIRCGAGTSINHAVNWCVAHNLSGMEFLTGIPGSLGGAVKMNAGAFGKEMVDIVKSVTVLNVASETLERKEIQADQIIFNYREMIIDLPGFENAVVLEVELSLVKDQNDSIREMIEEYKQKRQKQPKGMSTAGSVFRNPVGDYAGRLIEKSGLKGVRIGGAMVSDVHANFFLNMGDATCVDILQLIKLVQKRVEKDSKIKLVPEIIII